MFIKCIATSTIEHDQLTTIFKNLNIADDFRPIQNKKDCLAETTPPKLSDPGK